MPKGKGIRQKTFSGCRRCRERKIKCDGRRPLCLRCAKAGISCPGFPPNFTWVTPNQSFSAAQGLGGLSPTATWEGYRIYTTDDVDCLINDLASRVSNGLDGGDTEFRDSPFSVLDFRFCQRGWTCYSMSPLMLQPSPIYLDVTSQRLLHHYVTIIAPLMMPMDDNRNPWKTYYPMSAISQESKLHSAIRFAILSQAAAHLLHLGCNEAELKTLTINYHSAGLRHLRNALTNVDTVDFELLLASILSLIMAEVLLAFMEFRLPKANFRLGL